MSDRTALEQIVRDNLARIREQIAAAAAKAGRSPDDIRLIGVTKYVDAVAARALFDAGCHDLAESRPQELWAKAEALADVSVRWHQIGHLQRNKVKRTLPCVSMFHSGDSVRLVNAIDREAGAQQLRPQLLLEVNISGESAKHGFTPEELRRELPNLSQLAHVELVGMMAMASREGGRDQARRDFAAARKLFESMRTEAPKGVDLRELSLGMSGDFEEAVADGSTMVRIGSALWEGLE